METSRADRHAASMPKGGGPGPEVMDDTGPNTLPAAPSLCAQAASSASAAPLSATSVSVIRAVGTAAR